MSPSGQLGLPGMWMGSLMKPCLKHQLRKTETFLRTVLPALIASRERHQLFVVTWQRGSSVSMNRPSLLSAQPNSLQYWGDLPESLMCFKNNWKQALTRWGEARYKRRHSDQTWARETPFSHIAWTTSRSWVERIRSGSADSNLVEPRGVEPLTPTMPLWCKSSSWVIGVGQYLSMGWCKISRKLQWPKKKNQVP